LAVVAERLLDDASPLVRGAAVWALSRLCGRKEFAALEHTHGARESDADVIGEWVDGRSAA
jgi:epoxyqueuosine reductase